MTDLAPTETVVVDLTPDDAPTGYQGITDDSLAVWAISHLGRYQRELDRLRRNTQELIDQIQTKATEDERVVLDKIAWFTGQLVDYRRQLEAANPYLAKTYKLPNGNLSVTAGRKRTVITGKDELVAWALENAPEVLSHDPRVSHMADWPRADDGRILSPDGEPVPGVEVQCGEPSYKVTVSTTGDDE